MDQKQCNQRRLIPETNDFFNKGMKYVSALFVCLVLLLNIKASYWIAFMPSLKSQRKLDTKSVFNSFITEMISPFWQWN